MKFHRCVILSLSALALLILGACTPAAASTKPATRQALPTGASTLVSSPRPQTRQPASPSPSPSPSPSQASSTSLASTSTQSLTLQQPTPSPCPPGLCTHSSQFFLARPIAQPGNDSIDGSYRFGSTQSGYRDPHHGVEFLNGYGAPVLAAASGVVVVAGEDRQPTSPQGAWPITFYGPYLYFYGNLVVIEHSTPAALQGAFPDLPGPVYTLYAHLSEISVQTGQTVEIGGEIGKVGMTGIAEGSHLHFEVRLGENTYENSRNPELWLKPHTDKNGELMGALAGRFIDSFGENLSKDSIVLEHLSQGPDSPSDFRVTLLTYEEQGLTGQPPWEESFAIGDIPAGWYRISFPHYGLQQELLQVYPGQLTVITFQLD